MAQTENSIWGGAAKVEWSSNGSTWLDITGWSNAVNAPTVERRQGEAYTFGSEYPIVKVGKRNSIRIPVRIVYTEYDVDVFNLVRIQFETAGGGTAYVRWTPAGTGGFYLWTTDAGFVQSFTYPPVSAEEDGPILLEFTIQCAQITLTSTPSHSVSPSVSPSA